MKKALELIRQNSLKGLDEALAELTDINQKDVNGHTLLMTAVVVPCDPYLKIEILKRIFMKNPDLDARDRRGATALHFVAQYSELTSVAGTLIYYGADVNAQDLEGNTPLHYTAIHDNQIIFTLLIGNTETIRNLTNNENHTAVSLATSLNSTKVIDAFITCVNIQCVDIENKLSNLNRKSLDTTEHLERPDPSELIPQTKDKPEIPMNLTAMINSINATHNINAMKNEGFSLLRLAVDSGQPALVKAILSKKPKVDTPDNIGLTPLYAATSLGDLESVRLLIRAGANVNVTTLGLLTPLHTSTIDNNLPLVKLLVKNGANLDAMTQTGETAYDLAIQCEHEEIQSFLAETLKERQINEKRAKDKEEENRLFVAAQRTEAERKEKAIADQRLQQKNKEIQILERFKGEFEGVHQRLLEIENHLGGAKKFKKADAVFKQIKDDYKSYFAEGTEELDPIKLAKGILKVHNILKKDPLYDKFMQFYEKDLKALKEAKEKREHEEAQQAAIAAEQAAQAARAEKEAAERERQYNYDLNLSLRKHEQGSSSVTHKMTVQYQKPQPRICIYNQKEADQLRTLVQELADMAAEYETAVPDDLYELKYGLIKFYALLDQIRSHTTVIKDQPRPSGAHHLAQALVQLEQLYPLRHGALHLLTLGASWEDQIALYQDVLKKLGKINLLNAQNYQPLKLNQTLDNIETEKDFPLTLVKPDNPIFEQFKAHHVAWIEDRAKNTLKEAEEMIETRVQIVAHHDFPLTKAQVMIATEVAELFQQLQHNKQPVPRYVENLITAKKAFTHQGTDIPAETLREFLRGYQQQRAARKLK